MASHDPHAANPFGPHSSTPAELQELLAAEARGAPFLLYRDGDGRQVIVELDPQAARVAVGREPSCELALTWDQEVSRLHAEIERHGEDWVLVDDGLSSNGSYVNGERVAGRRRLRDQDGLCFGATPIAYRALARTESPSTVNIPAPSGGIALTATQHKVLVALCRPTTGSAFATPSTNKEIADEVHLSTDAVKAHLRVLFERFGLEDLPQNQKRAHLASTALEKGLVSPRDY